MTPHDHEDPSSKDVKAAPTEEPPTPTADDDRYYFYGASADKHVRYAGWLRPETPVVTISGHLKSPESIATAVEAMERVFSAAGPTGTAFFSLGFQRCRTNALAPLAESIRRHVEQDGAKVHLTLWVSQPAEDLMRLTGFTLMSARIDRTDLWGRFEVVLNGEIR